MSAREALAANAPPTRVLIVEDHSMFTQSLSLMLRLEGMEPHIAVDLDDAAILEQAEHLRPDVVVLDLHLGEGHTSLSMVKPLSGLGTRVLVLTGSADESLQGAALAAGAVTVLEKGDRLETLYQGIRDVVEGRVAIRPSRRDELMTRGRQRLAVEARLSTLTAREGDVLVALVHGRSAATVASQLCVSVKTVRTHIESILRKLAVNSQLAAVALARQVDWQAQHPA
jgi:DNA-binding NarL/FixJ family response regulator